MSNFKSKYIGFVFLILFFVSYFLPVVHNSDSSILGFHFFCLQLLDFPFNSGFQDYIYYFIKSFLIVGVLLLFLNRWLRLNKYVVFVLSLMLLYTSISYCFTVINVYSFAYGYWIWVLSIGTLGVDCVLLAFNEKKNTVT
jgi:hypothetical protein